VGGKCPTRNPQRSPRLRLLAASQRLGTRPLLIAEHEDQSHRSRANLSNPSCTVEERHLLCPASWLAGTWLIFDGAQAVYEEVVATLAA
jgi:hypothetical protein